MNLLDLYEQRKPNEQNIDERQLQEGGVDNLEARRIDDLNMRMLELLDRAKEPAYKKNPAALAGLKKQFQKIKAERDSYFKINPATGMNDAGTLGTVKGALDELGIPGNVPTEKIPGKEDLLKGKGRTYYEGEAGQNPRALGVANFQRLVKANMGNTPTVSLEFIRPEENFKLDQRGLDLISDYYDGLENDQAKNYFIYRVLPSGDETQKVLKQLGWNPQQVQPPLPGIPTQGELPLQEKKKSNNDDLKTGDVKVARELQKLRARYPAVRSDIEAVASAEIDSTERSQQQLAAIRGANEKQDALLKQLVALDKEQGREINGLDQENNSLEQRLAQVQATNDRLQQAIGQMTGTKKVAAKTKTTEPQGSRDIAQGGIIDVGTSVTAEPVSQVPEPKEKSIPTKSAMGSMAQQLAKGFSNEVPLQTIKPPPASMRKAAEIEEHGGGIGPKQHWQDLMPEQSNPEDDDWYDDEEGQDTELRSGDYVRDTMDGESGEIFRMQGDPYERRVRILDRDGKGWYIEPGRLVVVDRNDPDIQRYFGKDRQHDMDEGWKSTLGGAALAGAMAVGAGGAQARVAGDHVVNPDVNRLTGKPNVAQTVQGDQVKPTAPAGYSKEYLQKAADPNRLGRYLISVEKAQELLNQLKEQDVAEAIVASGPSKPLDDRAIRKLVWDTMKINADTGEQAIQRALAVLAKKPQSRMVQDLQDKFQGLANRLAQDVAESAKPGEYYVHTVYFKDGTKKRVRVTSDEFNVANYYTKRGQAVDRVDYDFQLHSDMTEAEKEPTTRQELLNRVDKIQRMMTQERNPANLQILRKELEMLKQRYQHLREDNDSEAVERAILNRIMVAHTDLLMKFGPEKVMQAAEEVAYNVGDVDEIGTSDVSAYVNQVKQILGAVNETQVNEKWSAKYKSSINCANPKGFSQKAHCAGRKK
jgi:hypothetical protein